jgi:hypothetical protein
MEDSRRFSQTSIVSELQIDAKGGDTEEFEIAAIYTPEAVTDAQAPSTPTATATPSANPAQRGTPKPQTPKVNKH